MSAPNSFDLATLDAWCGCRPGMSRPQVEASLQAAGVEAEPYGKHTVTVTEDEWEMELYFTEDGSERLRQISIDGDAIHWAGTPLMDLTVDEALLTVQPHRTALWTDYDAVGTPFPDPTETPATPASDEALLLEGTIWIPERGLGLVIYEGKIFGMVWRGAQDLPPRYAGPVTAAQRELSRRPDLASYLYEKKEKEIEVSPPRDPTRFLHIALTLAALAALALTVRDGFEEMAMWANAPKVKATFISMERGPLKQFLEYLPRPVTRALPQWLVTGAWSDKPPQTDLYRMEYTDPNDRRREVQMEAAEFYMPPRQAGEEVELTFLDGNPPRLKGPARVENAAFMEHLPWAISIGCVWLAGHFALSFLPGLIWLFRRLIPSRKTFDPHRPELS